MVDSTNPLAKHFRQAQLYLKLPSKGRWYPTGSIEMPDTGELPVYAMTAKDELTLKTPDALLNGQSTVDVIQSCLPNIKDAWQMPAVDIDAVLIAIRQATYGNAMEFVSVCTHCSKKNENTVDLGMISQTVVCPNFDTTLKVDGLELFFKPQNYKQFNSSSMENYEQQRLIALVSDREMSEDEKMVRFQQLFRKLLDITVDQVTKSVAAIKTEDNIVVDDKDQLDEFFKNCNRTVWEAAKNHIQSYGDANPLKKIPIVCEHEECGKPYETPLIFETSSFFA